MFVGFSSFSTERINEVCGTAFETVQNASNIALIAALNNSAPNARTPRPTRSTHHWQGDVRNHLRHPSQDRQVQPAAQWNSDGFCSTHQLQHCHHGKC